MAFQNKPVNIIYIISTLGPCKYEPLSEHAKKKNAYFPRLTVKFEVQ